MPTPTIRPATPADLPVVVGLITELARYEKLEHLVEVTPERAFGIIEREEEFAQRATRWRW